MGDLTTTSYLILGMLANRDWSAYGIAEEIGRGATEIWPRAARGLYNAPKRLVERGYAEATRVQVGKRHRTMYSITPEGMEALRGWLAQPSKPPALEFEGMVRVITADRGSLDDLRNNLRTTAMQAAETRDLFVRLARLMLNEADRTHPERLHLMALANRFMIQHFCNVCEWATWALKETEQWDDTVSPSTDCVDGSIAMLEGSIRQAAASSKRVAYFDVELGEKPAR